MCVSSSSSHSNEPGRAYIYIWHFILLYISLQFTWYCIACAFIWHCVYTIDIITHAHNYLVYVCMYVCIYVCMYVCMYACMQLILYNVIILSMHYCMQFCILLVQCHVYRYVCMYVRVYICNKCRRLKLDRLA